MTKSDARVLILISTIFLSTSCGSGNAPGILLYHGTVIRYSNDSVILLGLLSVQGFL